MNKINNDDSTWDEIFCNSQLSFSRDFIRIVGSINMKQLFFQLQPGPVIFEKSRKLFRRIYTWNIYANIIKIDIFYNYWQDKSNGKLITVINLYHRQNLIMNRVVCLILSIIQLPTFQFYIMQSRMSKIQALFHSSRLHRYTRSNKQLHQSIKITDSTSNQLSIDTHKPKVSFILGGTSKLYGCMSFAFDACRCT